MPDLRRIISPWEGYGPEDYNCFVCSPNNQGGLRLKFYEDGDDVVTTWTPSRQFESWSHVLHGGIQATLIDEAGGWVICRKLQTCGVTTRFNLKYRKTVPTGKPLEVRCRISEIKRSFAILTGEIRVDGEVCTEAEMTYFCAPKEKAISDYRFTECKVEDLPESE